MATKAHKDGSSRTLRNNAIYQQAHGVTSQDSGFAVLKVTWSE